MVLTAFCALVVSTTISDVAPAGTTTCPPASLVITRLRGFPDGCQSSSTVTGNGPGCVIVIVSPTLGGDGVMVMPVMRCEPPLRTAAATSPRTSLPMGWPSAGSGSGLRMARHGAGQDRQQGASPWP